MTPEQAFWHASTNTPIDEGLLALALAEAMYADGASFEEFKAELARWCPDVHLIELPPTLWKPTRYLGQDRR